MVTSNRVTRSGGLIHGGRPILHAAHLSGIDRLSFTGPLCTANKMADEKKRFGGKLNYFITFSTRGRFSLSGIVILHCIK